MAAEQRLWRHPWERQSGECSMASPRWPASNHSMMARPLAPFTLAPSKPVISKPLPSNQGGGIYPLRGAAQRPSAVRAKVVPPRPDSSAGLSPQRSSQQAPVQPLAQLLQQSVAERLMLDGCF
ncbi:MAG: hypothetical protein RSD57_15160 [Comamonas sp.]